MGGFGSDMADIIVPARKSAIVVITLDTNARAKDLRSLLLGRILTPDPAAVNSDKVMLRIRAITADCWYHFDSTDTVTLDKTAALAAATGTLTTATTYGDVIPAGSFEDVTIDRSVDKYLHVQGSAAGTLIIRASSMVG